jgi:Skp family chaperone for outer membrane proteins
MTTDNENELERLQALLAQRDELLRQIEGERDDLRRRLDNSEEAREQAAAEVHRLTLMITQQSQQKAESELEAPLQQATHKLRWRLGRIFKPLIKDLFIVVVLIVAAIAAFWVGFLWKQYGLKGWW